MTCRPSIVASFLAAAIAAGAGSPGDDAADRRDRAVAFHALAQQPAGLLVPMYVYPGDVDAHPEWRHLLDAKRERETIPFWVIVNPASGPGDRVDPNYTRAIARLRGAGCVVLGYVTTSYGRRPGADVRGEVDRWPALYPGIHGIFFDEMGNEDTAEAAAYQAALSRHAHAVGLWPTVANPGTDVPARYFESDAADVLVVHEGGDWPEEDRLRGDARTGYADHPPWTRAVLVHSRPELDLDALRRARRHARWIYATDAPFRPGDPAARNPWNRLPRYLDDLCDALRED
jgi:hypothetical protein